MGKGLKSYDDACAMIDDIIAFHEQDITEWERNFCESIYKASYLFLSKKQTATLNRIYDRVMK